jgi:hypothetical protein
MCVYEEEEEGSFWTYLNPGYFYYGNIRLVCQVTLSSSPSLGAWFNPPIPSSSGIRKIRKFCEISGMNCCNSAFNLMHKGSRRIIVSCCRGRSTENICSTSGGAEEKGKTGMKLRLPPKLVEKKLVWVRVISLCKIFVPSYTCDAETGRSCPPNCGNNSFSI